MSGPRVVLAVTGSIAAYKACEVVRRLKDHGVDVRVAMTRAAAEFVSPMSFAALSGNRVLYDSFEDDQPERIPHVRWGAECDAFCAVPASADFIAKMALGLADDFPSTVHLAVEGSVLVAPAMEDRMWLNPAVQANVETLRSRGAKIIEPATGSLASGRHGPGRLAEPADIVDAIIQTLTPRNDTLPLAGRRVLVSAGPTREHFDPVRVFTNPSTGKMGYAIAVVARRLGAEVTLVSGPTQLDDPEEIDTERVVDAEQMRAAMLERAENADIIVMAAAVSDFRPTLRAAEKLKKDDVDGLTMEMERTPDILADLRNAARPESVVVGFAAETSDLDAHALDKLERKGCDLIVGNLIGVPGTGFASDSNEVVIFDRLGGRRTAGPAAKIDIAAAVWEAVADFHEKLGVDSLESGG